MLRKMPRNSHNPNRSKPQTRRITSSINKFKKSTASLKEKWRRSKNNWIRLTKEKDTIETEMTKPNVFNDLGKLQDSANST